MNHQEAHRLIQRAADEALSLQERQTLSTHLGQCADCRAYAAEIREIESILVPLMKRQWNLEPPPHSMAALRVERSSKVFTNIILPMRRAAVGIALLAFVFSAWQLALSGRQSSNPLPAAILPIPTPARHSTGTKTAAPACGQIHYRVQPDDTLESIARQFALSKQEIMAVNHLYTESLETGRELLVPLCNFTPTGTLRPASFSTRYTPSVRPITSTPGG